jgi:uncharacterized protein YjbI with pentapeptide repeats
VDHRGLREINGGEKLHVPGTGAKLKRIILGVVVAVAVVIISLYCVVTPDNDKEWQGFAQVLAIFSGGIAAFFGLYLTRQTIRTTRKVEEDRANKAQELETARARDAALRACLEQLGRLLTDDKWGTNDQAGGTGDTLRKLGRLLTGHKWGTKDQAGGQADTLRNLARAEAVSVLGPLDGPRKRILVRFLYESRLLDKDSPGVDLNRAVLREADLSRLNLSNAALSGVRLSGADLSRATLAGSDLSGSDLRDLRDSSNGDLIRSTNLRHANLSGTNLKSADLRGVDLSKAKNLAQKQIAQAVGDEITRLPGHLRPPEVWHKSEEEQLGED